jgi:hypothetical protein
VVLSHLPLGINGDEGIIKPFGYTHPLHTWWDAREESEKKARR